MTALESSIRRLASGSRQASTALYTAPAGVKNRVLRTAARKIRERSADIAAANATDLKTAQRAGLSSAMLDRLTLTGKRINAMVSGLRAVAAQADPAGQTFDQTVRPNGLTIQKVRVPIGSILIIYESRPNVTIDSAALCVKAGNAVILRGGKEAVHSNRILATLFREALQEQGLPADGVQLVQTTDRKAIPLLLHQRDFIDLAIPRGGEGLIRLVTENAWIPVLKHYKGVCHIFVDKEADPAMAQRIAVNAKTQRPGVCNAMETLLLDKSLSRTIVRSMLQALIDQGVEIRACPATRKTMPGLKAAKTADYYAEYLDLRLAVKTVNGLDDAVSHIRQYGSGHTDAIITRSRRQADRFLARVDSSSVLWNASTRFSDGGEYGLGAEIGISTDKLHARGPMGARDLTTYKWVVAGKGHVRE